MTIPKNETPEQRSVRLAKARDRTRNETPEQRERRLSRQRNALLRETPEEYALRIARQREYQRSLTPEKIERRRENQRRYAAKMRAEDPIEFARRGAAATRAYVAKNPEKAKAATGKWRAANKPKINAGRRAWRSRNIIKSLLAEARHRAKARGVEFSITIDDIPPMGTHCPLLGHPFPAPEIRGTISHGGIGRFTPSLDRIDPTRGYVPGNVWIVGYRANLVKNDGTAEEHELIARAMRLAQMRAA